MKQKKIPLRSCIVTKEKLPKHELIRIVKTKDGEVIVDLTGKINGHGVYIKNDLDVLEKVYKSRTLDKKLEINVKDNVYEDLEEIIKK